MTAEPNRKAVRDKSQKDKDKPRSCNLKVGDRVRQL